MATSPVRYRAVGPGVAAAIYGPARGPSVDDPIASIANSHTSLAKLCNPFLAYVLVAGLSPGPTRRVLGSCERTGIMDCQQWTCRE